MFHSMNQSRHDLKVGLHQAQQSYEMRLQELDLHHSHQLHQLRQRAQNALEEAEQRYQADLSDLRKRLEAEQSSRSAAQYHIESLQRNLRLLRDELEEKREDVSELPLLRETCRHQRDELRELQKLKQQLPELQRQLEESQAAQKKLQEKLRKAQKEKAEKVLEEPVEKAYEATAAPYTGWSEMPSQMAWSEAGQSYGYGQEAYGETGFNTEISQSGMPAEIQTNMAWEGAAGEGSMGQGQQTYGDGYGAEMSPYGEVHWAQQGVEGEAGFSPGWSEAAPQVKEKKKKKHREKKTKKQEEEHHMDDFASVSTTPTVDAWGTDITAAPAATAGGGGDGNIDAQVKMLKDMGFHDENRVRVVLEAVGNDVEKAVPVLLSEH